MEHFGVYQADEENGYELDQIQSGDEEVYNNDPLFIYTTNIL